jgi:rare lipoprotein A
MIRIIRGIVILFGIALVFSVITACSSDSVFARKSKSDRTAKDKFVASEKEEYTYNEEADDEKDNLNIKSRSGEQRKNRDSVLKEDNDSEQESYYQKGFASWYGREFHGRKTASGEKYDMNKLTAAHKKLPFGTKILVKNLENGKTINVTINDRGPYVNGRILDLSYGAAKKLEMIGAGEAKVGIIIVRKGSEEKHSGIAPVVGESNDDNEGINAKENIDNESDESIEDSGKSKYSIQAGAFYSRKNAERFQKRIEKLVEKPVVLIKENDLYKIKIDNFSTKKNADKVKKILKNEDITSYVVESRN